MGVVVVRTIARETSLGLWYQQYEVMRKMIMNDRVVSSRVVMKRWLAARLKQLMENQIAWIIARKLDVPVNIDHADIEGIGSTW
jgi:hypothetical protein